ncbi:MAG TPA: outer membrane protein transport protein [Verrucomicrobiae bacterium]
MKESKTTVRVQSRCATGKWWVAISIASLMGLPAMAEGFRNPTIGTLDLGRSGGRIAQVDDSSAVQQNPANLVEVTNAEVQVTPSIVYISADFQSSLTGQTATAKDPWKVLPNAFASVPLNNDRIALGLGVTAPYGLGSEWDQNGAAFAPYFGVLRYQTPYYSELQTINLNPTVAIRLTDNLSIGIGLDAMWSDLTLKQYYPSFLLGGAFESNTRSEGDGWGWGGNLGLTWKITPRQRLAITYRSPIDVDYSGSFNMNNLTPTEMGLGITPSSSFNTTMKFPTIVAAGYGIDVTDKIRLETDFEWVEFSRFKSLNLNAGNNSLLFALLGKSPNVPESWHNTFTLGIGGDWQFAEHWVLRAGYQYFESPVPNSTFSPTIPDSNQNVITLGIGWHGRHHSLEAAYGLDFYNDRHIRNNQVAAFNGNYSFNVHLLSFAYRYSF